MTKIAQLQFNREMGIEPTDSQLERLLADNAELLAFIEASEKEFSLSNGKPFPHSHADKPKLSLPSLRCRRNSASLLNCPRLTAKARRKRTTCAPNNLTERHG